jgi:L-ascorbate metabolism protein UlaG (beta-lactamase superfamily)
VPLGLGAWFKSCGIAHAVELDWWGEVQHPGSDVRVTFAPAQVRGH